MHENLNKVLSGEIESDNEWELFYQENYINDDRKSLENGSLIIWLKLLIMK